MDYSIGANFIIAINNLLQVLDCLFLGHSSFGGYELGQISSLTKLCDDVSIVFSCVYIENLNYVSCSFESF